MKDIGNEVNKILTNRKIIKKDFSAKLGMSPVNLSKIFKKGSVDALLLERIAKALNVSITVFFDEGQVASNIEQNTNEIEYLRKEVDMQKERLKDKEGQILLLEQLLTVQKQLNEDMRKQMVNAIKKKPE